MNGNRFFLDTVYVLALPNPNAAYHEPAKALYFIYRNGRPWINGCLNSRRAFSTGRLPSTVTGRYVK